MVLVGIQEKLSKRQLESELKKSIQRLTANLVGSCRSRMLELGLGSVK